MSNKDFIQELIYNISILSADTDEETAFNKLVPYMEPALGDSSWLAPEHKKVCPEQGWKLHTLREPEDNGIGIYVVTWLPQRGTPPHDHGDSWAIIGGVEGVERNVLWNRVDDGSEDGFAHLEKDKECLCYPGEIITMGVSDIHCVHNDSDDLTISLHVYSVHPDDQQERLSFDVEQKTVSEFITKKVG